MKPLLRVLPFLLAAATLGAPASAAPVQDAVEASTAAPAARTIIDRFIDETNLRHAVEKTKSRRTQGRMIVEAMGMEGEFEALNVKPNVQKMTMEMGGMGTVEVGFDGERAWQVHPMMGARIMDGIEAMQIANQARYDSYLRKPEYYESIETVGRTTFEGAECFEIKLIAKAPEGIDAEKTVEARTGTEYYDVETGLLAGTVTIQSGAMGEMKITSVISDYQKFGETLLPTKTVQKMAQGEFTLQIDDITYDDVTEEELALPQEIQGLIDEG